MHFLCSVGNRNLTSLVDAVGNGLLRRRLPLNILERKYVTPGPSQLCRSSAVDVAAVALIALRVWFTGRGAAMV